MKRRIGLSVMVATTIAFAANRAGSDDPPPVPLTVHEWGTFTSIAGEGGEAIEWLPQAGPSDLPCFVNRLGWNAKGQLSGTVRMETPVLYFYAPAPMTVDVRVAFPQGLITEWYPRADVTPRAIDTAIFERGRTLASRIEWNRVLVSPDAATDFPIEDGASHYYAARQTDAAPLDVDSHRERFLFYRGVGRFAPAVTATIASNGAIVVRNRGPEPLSGAIVVTSRNGSIAYQAQYGVDASSRFDALVPADEAPVRAEFEQMLVASGLYPAEARAMLATWGDSWFDEGTRLFFVVPRTAVDAILPLEIAPRPASIARVFVGRVELITDETLRAIDAALAAHDRATLAKYGRFLDAIRQRIVHAAPGEQRAQIDAMLQSAFAPWNVPQTDCRTSTN